MSKLFTVYLPSYLYRQAKEFSLREGPPMSFLVREGLRMVLEKRGALNTEAKELEEA